MTTMTILYCIFAAGMAEPVCHAVDITPPMPIPLEVCQLEAATAGEWFPDAYRLRHSFEGEVMVQIAYCTTDDAEGV